MSICMRRERGRYTNSQAVEGGGQPSKEECADDCVPGLWRQHIGVDKNDDGYVYRIPSSP